MAAVGGCRELFGGCRMEISMEKKNSDGLIHRFLHNGENEQWAACMLVDWKSMK
jgi:hypothetical protein